MANIHVKSEVAGTLWKAEAKVGQTVAQDDVLLIIECMKMEIPVVAPAGGTVAEIKIAEGEQVAEEQVLVVIEG